MTTATIGAEITFDRDSFTPQEPSSYINDNNPAPTFVAHATVDKSAGTVTIVSPAALSLQTVPKGASKPRSMRYTGTITATLPITETQLTPALDWRQGGVDAPTRKFYSDSEGEFHIQCHNHLDSITAGGEAHTEAWPEHISDDPENHYQGTVGLTVAPHLANGQGNPLHTILHWHAARHSDSFAPRLEALATQLETYVGGKDPHSYSDRPQTFDYIADLATAFDLMQAELSTAARFAAYRGGVLYAGCAEPALVFQNGGHNANHLVAPTAKGIASPKSTPISPADADMAHYLALTQGHLVTVHDASAVTATSLAAAREALEADMRSHTDRLAALATHPAENLKQELYAVNMFASEAREPDVSSDAAAIANYWWNNCVELLMEKTHSIANLVESMRLPQQ